MCYAPLVDWLLLDWAEMIRKQLGVKATRGNAVSEMARALSGAGWKPGQDVSVIQKQEVRGAFSTKPPRTHQAKTSGAK